MKRTIQKVLAELAKENPDLSYIRGLLEGLVDEESSTPSQISGISLLRATSHPTSPLSDEIMTDEQKTTAARYVTAGIGRIS